MMWFMLFKENRVLKSDTQKWRNTSRITWFTLFIWYRVCSFFCILKSRNFNPTFTSKTTMLNFFNYLHPRLICIVALLERRPPHRAWRGADPSAKILSPLSSASLHPPSPTATPWMSLKTPWFSPPFTPRVWVDFLYFFSIFSVLYFKHNPKLISSYCVAPIPPPSLVVICLIRSSYFIWVDFFRWGFTSTNGKYSPSFC